MISIRRDTSDDRAEYGAHAGALHSTRLPSPNMSFRACRWPLRSKEAEAAAKTQQGSLASQASPNPC